MIRGRPTPRSRFLAVPALAGIVLLSFLPAASRAQVEANFVSGGGIRIGWSTTTCNSGIAGAIRYNSASSGTVDLCNGTAWTSVASGGGGSIDALSDAITNYGADHNIFMGQGSGASIAAGGQYNIGVGENALNANTTGGTNLAIGWQTLRVNTTGIGNHALGRGALYSNTTGNNNFALGGSTLEANTTGAENVAIGNAAMQFNTTGLGNVAIGTFSLVASNANNNIAIGEYAMRDNTSGFFNTAIGTGALYTNVAKQESTAIGYQAMSLADSTATGAVSYNTAIGAYALMGSATAAANTGTNNTAIGHSTLKVLTSAINSTAVGSRALASVTTGNGNTAVGNFAGNLIDTGTLNSFMGNNAGMKTAGGSRNTFIGAISAFENLTGNRNTAIGNDALNNFTATGDSFNTALGERALFGTLGSSTGVNNTALGARSGTGITSGGNNTLAGQSAGANITTGSGNLILGYNISALSATASDQLNIGNTIYGDMANDYITIGGGVAPVSKFIVAPPTAQTIAAGNVIAADACGSTKLVTAAGPVTTDTTNTFTSATASYAGCCMDVINVGANAITLDDNVKFLTAGGANIALGSNDAVRVCTDGTNWFQSEDKVAGGGGGTIDALLDGKTDYVTDFNLFMGNNAGNAIASGGQYNQAVGINAGAAITTGDNNYAFGYRALASNTTGNYNIAIGDNALDVLDGGADNIAIGSDALGSSVTTSFNIAIGGNALFAAATTDESIAIGSFALEDNANGDHNIAIGNYALNEVTGGDNVAVGWEAGKLGLFSAGNTFLGHQAGRGVTGNNNNNNIGVGYNALYGLTTGSNNVALGYQAGNSISTGGTNILIGYDIDTPTATTNNHLNIGNALYGDLSTDKIGIGTSSVTGFTVNLDGDTAAQSIGMTRETTAATAGRDLTIQAGGAKSGGTDLAGGNLILSGGTPTGSQTSNIQFFLPKPNLASGGTDRSPVERIRLTHNGINLNSASTAEQALMFNVKQDASGTDTYWNSDSAFEIWHDAAADVFKFMAAPAGTANNTITYADGIIIDTAGGVNLASTLRLGGNTTSASLGASQNNYAPTGLANASVIRLTASTPISITGLTGGADGRIITLMNVGANAITLTDEDAASTAANRFALTGNLSLAADQSTVIIYDSTTSRWRVFGADGLGSGGSPLLSALLAATSTPTALANSTFIQTWNWALAAATADAFTFGETTAATGGSGDQSILKATTLAASTAIPLMVTNLGNGLSLRVNDATGDTDTTPFIVDAAGNVGIGVTTASYMLTLDGDTAAQTIGMTRETTAATAGRDLTIQAGGAKSGGTDLLGGNLILSGGTSTGTVGSHIEFFASRIGAGTGSADQAPAEVSRISFSGINLSTDGGANGQALTFNNKQSVLNGTDVYWNTDSSFEIWHDAASDVLRIAAAPSGTAGNAITYVDSIAIDTAGGVNIASTLRLGGDITSASLGASQNNYAPTGLANASVIRLTASTPVSITGLTGGADGRIVTLMNVGANAITLVDESASSTAGNRFALTGNLSLAADQSTVIVYDTTSSRWRVFGADGGGAPGGANTQVQFNDSGVFGGDADYVWNKTTNVLTVTGDIEYTGVTTDISDLRLKDNIAPLDTALDRIVALKPVSFTMKADEKKRTEYGFIAQDVQTVFPALVKTAEDEDKTLSLNYIGMIAPMVRAMQEQQKMLEAQQAQIDLLVKQNAEMKAVLDSRP